MYPLEQKEKETFVLRAQDMLFGGSQYTFRQQRTDSNITVRWMQNMSRPPPTHAPPFPTDHKHASN